MSLDRLVLMSRHDSAGPLYKSDIYVSLTQ